MGTGYRSSSMVIVKYMGVSKNRGTPKSSMINQPFWGFPIYGNPEFGKKYGKTDMMKI